jgi:hypothetical protein
MLVIMRRSPMSGTLKVLIALSCAVAAVLIAWSIQRARLVSLEQPDDRFRAFLGVRTAKLPACQQNLRQIEIAKELWADNEGKSTNDAPTWDDLRPYSPAFMKNHADWTNGRPTCPRGGTYTIGRVGEPPKCSIGGYYHSTTIYHSP